MNIELRRFEIYDFLVKYLIDFGGIKGNYQPLIFWAKVSKAIIRNLEQFDDDDDQDQQSKLYKLDDQRIHNKNENYVANNSIIGQYLRENLFSVMELRVEDSILDNQLTSFMEKMQALFEDQKIKSDRQFFSKVLRTMTDYINKLPIFGYEIAQIQEQFDNRNQTNVFLSYAYDDKLYTFGLYIFFASKDIRLHIDWMKNKEMKSGIDIKKVLSYDLEQCEQLLFLRTTNSELAIQGSHQIRQWCAWEIGHFYQYSRLHEKYYINLYADENKRKKNALLDDFKPFNTIVNGRLL